MGTQKRGKRLAKYQEMRDFTRTSEPSGRQTFESNTWRFVVQRHRARRRHYDFRLEYDGVLLSWAIPKGPTLDPKARRLAVHVEDHPLEYATFEGIIPAGQYGGGDVIVWDEGTWRPVDDPAKALAEGNLHFDLEGTKLRGRFVLIKPKKQDNDKEQWMLLHKNDDYAESGWDPEDYPRSVKSGRTNEQVKASPAAVWRSDMPADQAEAPLNTETRKSGKHTWKGPTKAEIRALTTLENKGTWHVRGRNLQLTYLDKVLFPSEDHHQEPITKRAIIQYYATIAPTMLPYLHDRPLNLHRFPNGITKPGFWQKETPTHVPKWLTTWRYEGASPGDAQDYIVADSAAALSWLANAGAIELHAWTSSIHDVQHPTWVLFDIDPGPRTSFADVLVLARLHHTALEHVGLQGKPKVSGQNGIQIWVPIAPKYTYRQTRAWAKSVSMAIASTVPDLVSLAWRKNKRGGLARLDYTQNVINKTLVVPYGIRPRPGATVSVPLEWAELDEPDVRPDGWTIHTIGERLKKAGDPFAELIGLEQELPKL
ncbi:MAG: ATP-dependent DNA ligase [Corynebacteriales bacterium]|nr:ATP-dependent DNA ligase [Mycobacteriales bacterium]